MNYWWLSFADPRKPRGEQFLGVILAPGNDFGDALDSTILAGINPGGEVLGRQMPAVPREVWRNRLLNYGDAMLALREINDSLGNP